MNVPRWTMWWADTSSQLFSSIFCCGRCLCVTGLQTMSVFWLFEITSVGCTFCFFRPRALARRMACLKSYCLRCWQTLTQVWVGHVITSSLNSSMDGRAVSTLIPGLVFEYKYSTLKLCKSRWCENEKLLIRTSKWNPVTALTVMFEFKFQLCPENRRSTGSFSTGPLANGQWKLLPASKNKCY